MSQEKVTLYSTTDLKNTTDDAIPAYLNSLKFRQSHFLSDTRLILGYTALIISAATFCWDYKYGFESTKIYTGVAAIFYTIINVILTFWITYAEKGIIYSGTNPQGDKIQISSKTEKYAPIYNLTITTFLHGQSQKPTTITLQKPFNDWFNQAGYFVVQPFQHMLASNVPIIGSADPAKKFQQGAQEADQSILTEEVNTENKSLKEKQSTPMTESSGVDTDQKSYIKTTRSGKKRGVKP